MSKQFSFSPIDGEIFCGDFFLRLCFLCRKIKQSSQEIQSVKNTRVEGIFFKLLLNKVILNKKWVK